MPVPTPRPQQVLFPLLGDHAVDQRLFVSTASIIDVLGATGISEHAVRAALSRMARGGILRRVSVGRRAYLGPTEHGAQVIRAGRSRTLESELVVQEWDRTWTTVLFTMPDEWQRQRSELRRRLQWAGFGALQSGVWIAPQQVDVCSLVADLEAAPYVRSLSARPIGSTDDAGLVATAYDLRALAAGYRAFERRWAGGGPRRLRDALVRQLVLTAEWLQAVRADPRLPSELLPTAWPGATAQQVFLTRWQELRDEAAAIAAASLDTIPAPASPPATRPPPSTTTYRKDY